MPAISPHRTPGGLPAWWPDQHHRLSCEPWWHLRRGITGCPTGCHLRGGRTGGLAASARL